MLFFFSQKNFIGHINSLLGECNVCGGNNECRTMRMIIDQLTHCMNSQSATHTVGVYAGEIHQIFTFQKKKMEKPITPTCLLTGGLQFCRRSVFNSISSRVTAFSLCLRFVAIGITLVHQALCCAVHIRLGSVRSISNGKKIKKRTVVFQWEKVSKYSTHQF